MCRAFFSFFWGWDLALYCTYVHCVCCVIPCPILLVRTSFHTVSRATTTAFSSPYTENINRFFGGMYRTVCCVIPSPVLLVRTSFHTVFSCDHNSVSSPYTQNINSYFGGMYRAKHHQRQACTLLYTRTCVVIFLGGWDVALYCTYLPRVCCVIPCPILLVRTSYHTVFSCFSCDNNSVFITLHSEQHELLWWDVSKK